MANWKTGFPRNVANDHYVNDMPLPAFSSAAGSDGAVLVWDVASNSYTALVAVAYYGTGTQTNSGTDTVTLGRNATTAGSSGGVAIGMNAIGTGTNSTAIGANSVSTGINSTAIGDLTNSSSSACVALGLSASATNLHAIAIGEVTANSGNSSSAIGHTAICTADVSVVIGNAPTVSTSSAVVIGPGARATTVAGGVAIGNATLASSGGVAFGPQTTSSGSTAVAVGITAIASAGGAVALGRSAVANVTDGIAINNTATTNSVASAIAIGAFASPLNAAHAIACIANSVSVVPGTLGLTVNGAAYVLPRRSLLYATTAGAGPTTLVATSAENQFFTTAQSVTLPVTSTLQLGYEFRIVNLSTGNLTVKSSGGGTKITLAAATWATLTCILTSGTTITSWSALAGGAAT